MRILILLLLAVFVSSNSSLAQDSTSTDLASYDRIRIVTEAAQQDIQEIQKKIRSLNAEIMAFSREYGKNHPEVQRRQKILELISEVQSYKRQHNHTDRKTEDQLIIDSGPESSQTELDLIPRINDLESAISEVFEILEERKTLIAAQPSDSNMEAYFLKYVPADQAAGMIREVLGDTPIRIAVNKQSNSLLVNAHKEVTERLLDILGSIDQVTAKEEQKKTEKLSDLSQSLLVRIFWLSSGPANDDSLHALNYLPEAVIDAIENLGVADPRLVLQSNTSVALHNPEDSQHFKLDAIPAITYGNREDFMAEGEIHSVGKDRISIKFASSTRVKHGSTYYNKNLLSGSMIVPLNHYVVLGTTNYLSVDPDDETKAKTAQFAYVVQITAAESYAPESNKLQTEAKRSN